MELKYGAEKRPQYRLSRKRAGAIMCSNLEEYFVKKIDEAWIREVDAEIIKAILEEIEEEEPARPDPREYMFG